ncbi:MAG: HEAT repeat domain-containing protein [Deltaproteobacteria bacterium]|nr:HEAT repeat domain-containing protein [Deltaproteobacteria bacterium]
MPRPFVSPDARTHFAPDCPVTIAHTRLELAPDLAARSLRGRVTLSLQSRRDDLGAVELDAVDMTFADVTVDQVAAATAYDGKRLRVELPRAYQRGEKLTLYIAYHCRPVRGLYFVGPDEAHPERPLECWTQGQDEDSRFYFPCMDAPLVKSTSEVLCTAPTGVFVLSNGDLRERRDLGDGRTLWHYGLDFPHSPYLVTLVCGPFAEIKTRAPETGVEVYYYGPKGREADIERTLRATPAIIDFFSKTIGVRYPFARYSQIFVSDFIFGGMENTTATTLTGEAILDERAALDHDVDYLVAHELAHQWWGDLVTCREWPEAWLNEGFATYFEYVWRTHSRSRDEADIDLLGDMDGYLDEAGEYQRPIVCRQFEEPIDLFDRHLYEKGGRVLHMLRHELGDAVFWRAIRLYAERHARGSVETRDLARTVEDASGRNLDRFFHQWTQYAGHPELECTWQWDADKRTGSLRVEQKQEGDKLYDFNTGLRLEVAGRERDVPLHITLRSHTFDVRLDEAPTQVVFDPGDVLLKTVKFDKPRPLWVRQLAVASLAIDRVLAARALADKPDGPAVAALRQALETDAFWAVRAAAATALGKTRRQDALSALLAARGQEQPKVRRAVAAALGEFRIDYEPGNARAAELLAAWVRDGDPSCFVEANAALALGRVRSPRAVEVLGPVLERRSYMDTIRARALEGLGVCGDAAAYPVIETAISRTATFQSRRAAVTALGRLAEGTANARRARERLEACLSDSDFRVRMDAASALVEIGDARAIPAIERALAGELDGRARRRFRNAITQLREKGDAGEKLRKLGEEVERLRGESARLRERLEKLEAKAPDPSAPPAPAPAAAKRPRPGSHRPGRKPLVPRRR